MRKIIDLNKDRYSEQVVRKALYWLSETCEWTLEETLDKWNVILNDSVDACEPEFHRLLNDYVLREQLDIETKNTRKDVISSILNKLGKKYKDE